MAESLNETISCIILAGGQARRMQGEDKGLVHFRQRPLIEHVLERIRPQVSEIIISANRNTERYAVYADAVIADQLAGYSGPLAGIASCLPHCQQALTLVVACDMPQLPRDLVARLSAIIAGHEIAIASSEAQPQLAFLLSSQLLDSITAALANQQLKLMDWINSRDVIRLDFSEQSAFINLNTLYDLDSVS